MEEKTECWRCIRILTSGWDETIWIWKRQLFSQEATPIEEGLWLRQSQRNRTNENLAGTNRWRLSPDRSFLALSRSLTYTLRPKRNSWKFDTMIHELKVMDNLRDAHKQASRIWMHVVTHNVKLVGENPNIRKPGINRDWWNENQSQQTGGVYFPIARTSLREETHLNVKIWMMIILTRKHSDTEVTLWIDTAAQQELRPPSSALSAPLRGIEKGNWF